LYSTNEEISFSKLIVDWYRKNCRNLPWRKDKDPYKIWLSEVMLQQTKVSTVIPYYNNWLKRFPTIQHVASSDIDEVIKIWEGLGYYSRCRNFYRACKIIVDKYDGTIPFDWTSFRSLPGVGDYTAAAVLSIAYNYSYPVIDGNVRRVLARIMSYDKIVKKGDVEFRLKLEGLIDKKFPGDFNQAMMELGSIICKRTKPDCNHCPVFQFCKSYKEGTTHNFPVVIKKKKPPHNTIVVGIIWKNKKFFIQKRPYNGLLGGLWEFPGGKLKKGEKLIDALVREIYEETGFCIAVGKKVGSVKHEYSHFSISLHLFNCQLINNSQKILCSKSQRWISPGNQSKFAFPKANHKLFQMLESQSWDNSL
tara:strand:+ start:22347 stop:23435 length:1089 start_codon:yes stop_codon:yes gene_type:complete